MFHHPDDQASYQAISFIYSPVKLPTSVDPGAPGPGSRTAIYHLDERPVPTSDSVEMRWTVQEQQNLVLDDLIPLQPPQCALFQ